MDSTSIAGVFDQVAECWRAEARRNQWLALVWIGVFVVALVVGVIYGIDFYAYADVRAAQAGDVGSVWYFMLPFAYLVALVFMLHFTYASYRRHNTAALRAAKHTATMRTALFIWSDESITLTQIDRNRLLDTILEPASKIGDTTWIDAIRRKMEQTAGKREPDPETGAEPAAS
ncbi:MAG: hypothetical protein OEY28_13725 [Nitrospira sp.]|nr:hypothetical protein [Nitrospira sp.]